MEHWNHSNVEIMQVRPMTTEDITSHAKKKVYFRYGEVMT